jgi:hypothetical protein
LPTLPPGAPDPAITRDRTRPIGRDALAATLTAIGAAGVLAGGVVFGLAARESQGADGAATYAEFDRHARTAGHETIAAAVAIGVGGACLIGGIARYAVLLRGRRR